MLENFLSYPAPAASTAGMIWLCACVRYWPYHNLDGDPIHWTKVAEALGSRLAIPRSCVV